MTITKKLVSILAIAFLIPFIFLSCEEEEEKPASLNLSAKATGINKIEFKVTLDYGSKATLEHGLVWSESSSPTIHDNKYVNAGGLPPTYVYTIKDLKLNTTYFIKAYVINTDNEIFYSNEVSLATGIHVLRSFSPASVSSDMEVIVYGDNFDPSLTTLFLDDLEVDANITDSTITFIVPFGLQKDSLILGVNIGDTKLTFPKKLHYLRGRWVQRATNENDTALISIELPATITIAGKAYVKGMWGYNYKSIYEYNPEANSWTEKTMDPYKTHYMQWFAIGEQIFAVTDNSFWMYDVYADQWYDLPSLQDNNWSIGMGISFSFDNKGYIGITTDKNDIALNEIWSYDPLNPSWTKHADFPGNGFSSSLALSTNEGVFIIGGLGDVSTPENWRYDPTEDKWTRKADYPGQGRTYLSGFAVNGKIYVGCGSNGDTSYKDFWEYNPATDKWVRIVDFVELREGPYSFSIDNAGYVGGGWTRRYKFDLWRLDIE